MLTIFFVAVKKNKTKTPAQDRLQSLTTQLKAASEKSKKTGDSKKSLKTDAFRKINIAETFKKTESLNKLFTGKSETNVNTTISIEDIPRLFPPNTPGQDRLNRLRNSLNPQSA